MQVIRAHEVALQRCGVLSSALTMDKIRTKLLAGSRLADAALARIDAGLRLGGGHWRTGRSVRETGFGGFLAGHEQGDHGEAVG